MNLTVAELILALVGLPADVQGYEVWIEADPSSPIREEGINIDHITHQVWL